MMCVVVDKMWVCVMVVMMVGGCVCVSDVCWVMVMWVKSELVLFLFVKIVV